MVAAAESVVSTQAISSRDRILARIAAANTKAKAGRQPIPRAYERISARDAAATVALFEERLREYDALVHRVHPDQLLARLAEILQTAGRKRIAAPTGLPESWRQQCAERQIEWLPDEGLPLDTLNGVDGVVTAASVGVAVSGSIVLQHGPSEGRRVLTLLPDYHLCVVAAAQVVDTLPEAFARIAPGRPVTFFSGPSATADIEMTRVKGVHGPRFLEVVIVDPNVLR